MVGVGYSRVSTNEQVRNGVSLDAQTASIQAWAQSLNITLLKTIEDAGISGTGIRQRPGLQEALKLTRPEGGPGGLLPVPAVTVNEGYPPDRREAGQGRRRSGKPVGEDRHHQCLGKDGFPALGGAQ